MKTCKICSSAADKTGSHIVPHFLMKRIDTEEGKKGRDKELGFVISEKNPSSYFGRGASLEKLNEIFGEIDETRINNNQIPLVEDYIFCHKCENELAELESNYSKSINNPSFNSDRNYSSKISADKALLFWISIMYRLSISANSGVKMLPEHEELLREILDLHFSSHSVNKSIERIRYKLFRAYDYSSKNSTVLHFNPKNINPYLVVIDEYILIFSIDTEPLTNKFYSVNLHTENAVENNIGHETESLYCLDYAVLSKLNQAFFDTAAERYKLTLFEQCDIIYAKAGLGRSMPPAMKEEIFENIARVEKPVNLTT
ncbi:hypothetical protein ASF10_23135 [Flavobacterium sp. Leaf82]|uniref:hypothetical protein n=1 Tax=Flavobacterium sp. Leaf82 TaxID=1736238 RepID=UPI0006F42E05|nr:hypothetical protein [Flavobacterium sp. Leaf82]KQO28427.1 hypothetical protein ASF10_23135 [Flavobacterium sp. Leaf82]